MIFNSDVMTTNYGKITSPQIHHKEENVSLCINITPFSDVRKQKRYLCG